MRLLALALLLPVAGAAANAQRLTLQIKWTADSSWKGEYYRKPYQFAVHEELEGRLVFDVADSSVRTVELRDNGATSGATLVEAAGVTAYRVDTRKEAGDCAPDGKLDAPLVGREEARSTWDSRAPGMALVVLRSGAPVGLGFSPKAMIVEGVQRLLCDQPETTTRRGSYRLTMRAGVVVKPDGWVVEAGPTSTTARYRFSARQQNPARDDPSGSIGELEVTKTLVLSWSWRRDANGSASEYGQTGLILKPRH